MDSQSRVPQGRLRHCDNCLFEGTLSAEHFIQLGFGYLPAIN